MGRVTVLIQVGYSIGDAEFLSGYGEFHHKTKSAEELLALFQRIADVYGSDIDSVKRAVVRFPQFAGLNHERVVREAAAVYGDVEAVKKAVIIHPQFAGLNHERVVREATDVYGDEEAVKRIVMKNPSFAAKNHKRVVRDAASIYGDSESVKKIILKWPPFANYDHAKFVGEAAAVYGDEDVVKKIVMRVPRFVGLDHERVVTDATAVYGDEEGVKKAVMKFPQFAGLDHEKKVCSLLLIAEIVGMDEPGLVSWILENPKSASYAVKRYAAGLDVGRELSKQGFKPDKDMLDAYFRHIVESPYVPRTRRRRISQCPAGSPEPPLLKKMRASLKKVA